MLSVRALLFAAWLVLISSLFWDPVTPSLTRASNKASPFRVQSAGLAIQDQKIFIENKPYAMGPRIFWTMLVPIVPLFLMTLGHEAWRRVCPLSFASQLPRMLGFGRKRKVVQRRSGTVEMKIPLLKRGSWLERNGWYLQFGLLYAGVSARLLFANSSPVGLALLLLGVIGASMTVGYLWGGKTWCNYICPINVVQKIYTEPGGLLESPAHTARIPITQSMCRKPSSAGDKNACVGCTPNCGDIDLERSYWDSILNPARRNVYYMFFGLIVGFYGYYFLYAGTWDYYFSGIWTHESHPARHLLDAGFYIGGRPWPVAKLVAAPATLALACGGSLLLGRLLESLYRRLRNSKKPTPDGEVLHHCMSVCAFLCINTFYCFGGRPNILLMPTAVMHIIDIAIVVLTTLWLIQALQRTPLKHRREGMAANLLEQLKKLKVDVSRYLEGRTIEELKPDEVYVLTKVLPAFTHEQKLQAYGRVLEEAVANGSTSSAATLRMLSEMRAQMDISDEEHLALLDGEGERAAGMPDVQKVASTERAVNLLRYQELLGVSVVSQLEAGRTIDSIGDDPTLQATSRLLSASLHMSQQDHAVAMQRLVQPGGEICMRLQEQLEQLRLHMGSRFFFQSRRSASRSPQGPEALLMELVEQRKPAIVLRMLSLLRALRDSEAAYDIARSMAAVDGQTVRELLSTPVQPGSSISWEDGVNFPPRILSALQGQAPNTPSSGSTGLKLYTFHDVISSGLDAAACLRPLVHDDDPVVRAVALSVAAQVDKDLGKLLLADMKVQAQGQQHRILTETVDMLTGKAHTTSAVTADAHALQIRVTYPDGKVESKVFEKRSVTVGRGLGNDLPLQSDLLAPYHLRLLQKKDGRLQIIRLDTATLFIDGAPCREESLAVGSGTRLTFCDPERSGPELLLVWANAAYKYDVQHVDSVTKLAWLRACAALQSISLAKLANMAVQAEVRRYAAGERPSGDQDDVAFVLHAGDVLLTQRQSSHSSQSLNAGELLIWQPDRSGLHPKRFVVRSEFAVLLAITDVSHVRLALSSAVTGLPLDPGQPPSSRCNAVDSN